MKGKFITIYGINNIGKTHHSKRLVERLNKMGRRQSGAGKRAVYLKYPIYDQKPTGPLINRILRSNKKQKISEEELQLWFVLNRYQFEPTLKKMLAEGKIVVAEDYVGTGIAWGTAKGANQSELKSMNKYLVQPDLALFMDGERVLQAKEKKHIHESDDKLAAKCQAVYRKLSRKYGWKKVLVDADPDVTAERVWGAVRKMKGTYLK